jgi:isopenicillin N synthase-like dioxygenase
MENAFDSLESISINIIEALEVSFGLAHGNFLDKITHEKNASEFRLNHYPAIDVNEIKGGMVSRIWPHFDLGVITLLFQDSIGGLEFENRAASGTFNHIKCSSTSELIVNVSETLQRWTNNRLLAGLHCVSIPEYMEESQDGVIPERYSIAYFCKADREASVGPLKPFIPEDTKSDYEDISAIDYQKERLLSAY